LHHDERAAALFADVVDGADIRMIESGTSLCFSPKALQCLLVARRFFGKELEGHEPVKPCVFRLVDHAHAATAKSFEDAVVRDGLPEE
jgi:hypothetical protein